MPQVLRGHQPWNKGLHGIHLSPATELKPGCMRGEAARRYRPIGTISIRDSRGVRSRWIKVREDGPLHRRWMPLSRWIWERRHGPIPAGHCVVYRDGNPLHDVIDNYALILRRDLPRFQESLDATLRHRKRCACSVGTLRRWRIYRRKRAVRAARLDTDRTIKEEVGA